MATNQIAAAESVLRDTNGHATEKYTAYLEHQAAYQHARNAYDEALALAQENPVELQLWPVTGMRHQRNVEAAYDRWIALGSKTEIERALGVLAAADRPPPSTTPPGACD